MNYRITWMSLTMIVVSESVAIAQTLTTNEPPIEKFFEVVLKLGFPVVMTVVGPSVTYFIKGAHPIVKYLVASLASMLVGAGAGTIPEFPLGIESAATIGVTSGAIGQKLFMMGPNSRT